MTAGVVRTCPSPFITGEAAVSSLLSIPKCGETPCLLPSLQSCCLTQPGCVGSAGEQRRGVLLVSTACCGLSPAALWHSTVPARPRAGPTLQRSIKSSSSDAQTAKPGQAVAPRTFSLGQGPDGRPQVCFCSWRNQQELSHWQTGISTG